MDIGNRPITATLLLIPGQDFEHEIDMPSGAIVPAGTTVDLIIYDTQWATVLATWDATVTSANISWDVDYAVSDTINLPANFRIYVHYSDGNDVCWYSGQVARA
jgi:hypothetical protein